MAAIEHFNTIKAPASKVYEALSTQEGLSEVWIMKVYHTKGENSSIKARKYKQERTAIK